MILNAIALLVLVACAVAGLMILRDRLARVRENVHPVCARCDGPAAELTDFICPHCGHDVREQGLAIPATHSPLALFWRAVTLTSMVAIGAALLYLVAMSVIPPVTRYSVNASISPRAGKKLPFSQIEVAGYANEWRDHVDGTIAADLYVAGRDVSTLEVDAATMTVRVASSPAGIRQAPAKPFDRAAIVDWFEQQGADVSDPEILAAVDQVYSQLLGFTAGGRKGNVNKIFSGVSGTLMQSSTSSSSTTPPDWLRPGVVIVAALGWLLILRRIVRPPLRQFEAAEEAAETT